MLDFIRKSLGIALFAASLLGVAVPVAAGETTLHDALAAGSTLTVRTIGGFVRVSHASGAAVVRASARANEAGQFDMHVAETRSGGNWTVCEVPVEQTSCDSHADVEHNGSRGRVDLTVTVPGGVKLDVATVSGDVAIEGVTSGVDAKSVSGHVKIVTMGAASATTVSGDLDVRVGSVASSTSFDSVSGRIALVIPRATNATVNAKSLSGAVTGSGVNFSGERGFIGRNLRAKLGSGASDVDIHTVSGSIDVKTI